jgi:ADP-ribose pyrophosphatase
MTKRQFEILNCETLFQGYFRLDRYLLRHEKFSGEWSRPFTRELFDNGGHSISVLPYDPQADKVVLIEEFRMAPLAHDEYPWLIQTVAGKIDSGEAPGIATRREAVEEAGCAITDLQHITDVYLSPGTITEQTSLYVGRTVAPEHESVGGLAQEDEDIRVIVLPAAEALNLLYARKIRDAVTTITLQWFALHHTELRSRWLVSEASTPII